MDSKTHHSEPAEHARTFEEHGPGEHAHPGPREYVTIAVILAIITAIEVAILDVAFLRGILVPLLLVLSAVKFVLVVMWFMHLKFDNRLFSLMFAGPLVMIILVMLALLGLFAAAVRVVP